MFSCIICSNGNSLFRCGLHRARPGRCGAGLQGLGLFPGRGNDLLCLHPGPGKDLFAGTGRLGRGLGSLRLFTVHGYGLGLCRLGGLGLGLFRLGKDGPGQQACPFADLGYGLFPLDGHDMHTGDTLDLLDLVDDVHTDVDALFLLVAGPLHPLDHLVGDIHARDKLFHVARHAQGLRRRDTGQDVGLFMEAEVPAHLHEAGEFLHVVDDLGLDKVSAVLDLLAKAYRAELKGIGKGVGGGAEKQFRRLSLDLLAALELPVVAHVPDHAQQLDGVHVKDTLGAGMVAELLVVTGETEQVFQAHGRRGQDIALHADAVAVTAGHLDDRFHALGLGDQAGADTRHPDNRCLAVGDVDGIDIPSQDARLFPDHFRVTVFRRSQLTGDSKRTAFEYPLQIAP